MAWTDAARRAALEVRRAHAAARGAGRQRALGLTPLGRVVNTNKDYRAAIARHLRALRAGGKARRASMKMGYSVEGTALMARESTAARNMYARRRR